MLLPVTSSGTGTSPNPSSVPGRSCKTIERSEKVMPFDPLPNPPGRPTSATTCDSFVGCVCEAPLRTEKNGKSSPAGGRSSVKSGVTSMPATMLRLTETSLSSVTTPYVSGTAETDPASPQDNQNAATPYPYSELRI